MIQKIIQKVEALNYDSHKVITKVFQRGLEIIETRSAYVNGNLYHRNWTINGYGKKKIIKQSYSEGKPIKGSRIDLQA